MQKNPNKKVTISTSVTLNLHPRYDEQGTLKKESEPTFFFKTA